MTSKLIFWWIRWTCVLCAVLLGAHWAEAQSVLGVRLTRCQAAVHGELKPEDPLTPGFANRTEHRLFRVHYAYFVNVPGEDPLAEANRIESVRLCIGARGGGECPEASPWVIFDRTRGIGTIDPAKIAPSFKEINDRFLQAVDIPNFDWDDSTDPEQIITLQVRLVGQEDPPVPPVVVLPQIQNGYCAGWERLGSSSGFGVFGAPNRPVEGLDHCNNGYLLQWRSPFAACEGEQICGAKCVNIDTDPNHCGRCGRACPAMQGCNDGSCRACAAGETLCAGSCIDVQLDASHCGGCGVSCGTGQACQAGTCVAAPAGTVVRRTPASTNRTFPFCISPDQGQFIADIMLSAEDAQRNRLQGALSNKISPTNNAGGPFHVLVGPQSFSGGTAWAGAFIVDVAHGFPTLNPASPPVSHDGNVTGLISHEYFHSFHDHWGIHNTSFWPVLTVYAKESLADQMRNHLCFMRFPDATGSTTPGDCISNARLHGANVHGGTIVEPWNGQLLTSPYTSSLFWQYLANQYSYPAGATNPAHPGGQDSVIPRFATGDTSPLSSRPFTDEGYDFVGTFFDQVKGLNVGPFEALRQALPNLLGRQFQDVVLDYHTAIYLKDYTDTDPRWRFDVAHDKGFQAATLLANGKPFAVPADVTGATCGTGGICDGFKRARRAYDSFRPGVGLPLVVPLVDGGFVSSDGEGGPASVGLFGTNAVSTTLDAGLAGKTVTVRAETPPSSKLRFRLFEIQAPTATPTQLVPRAVCGTSPTFECELTEDKESGRLELAQTVPITAESRELILIASSGSTGGCARGTDLASPTDGGTGVAASCERFDWSFGTPVPRVSILKPITSRPALIGAKTRRLSFLAAFRLLDDDNLPLQFAADDVTIRLPGCAAPNCDVPKENMIFVPATDGTVLAVVTVPEAFYPTGVGTFDFEIAYAEAASPAVETAAVQFNDAGHTQSVALLVDKSGSMGFFGGVKLTALKTVSSAIVTALVPPDTTAMPATRLGLIAFDEDAETPIGMDWITAANKDQYIGSIVSLTANGGTSIGDGLLESQSVLASDRAAQVASGAAGTDGDAIIIVSDGVNENPSTPDLYFQNEDPFRVPANDGRGDPWFSREPLHYKGRESAKLKLPLIEGIAIGQDADVATLEQLTRLSGGKPIFISGAIEGTPLSAIVPELSEAMLSGLNDATQFHRTGTALLNGTVIITDPVPRQASASGPTQFTFTVETGARTLRLTATAPRSSGTSGTLTDPAGVSHAPSATSLDGTARTYRIEDPRPGNWTFASTASQVAAPDIFVEAAVQAPGQLFSLVDVQHDGPEAPAPSTGSLVVIRAVPVEFGPVTNCFSMTAEIRKPGGSKVLRFPRDDGSLQDEHAGDGIYTLAFRETQLAGMYDVKLRAVCTSPVRRETFVREVRDGFILQRATDQDGDGLPDGWERGLGLDPSDARDATLDQDGDGLTGGQEYTIGTNPFLADTDGGGLTDREVLAGRDPLDPRDDGAHTPVPEILPGDGRVYINPAVGLDGRTLEVQRGPRPEGPWTTLTQAWTPGQPYAFDTNAPNGVRVCYRMRYIEAGLASAWTVPLCTTPAPDPISPQVSIDPFGPTCGLESVRLKLRVDDPVSITDSLLPVELGTTSSALREMRIWFGGGQAPATWVPFVMESTVRLPTTTPTVVNVQVRDAAGNESKVAFQVLSCSPVKCPGEPAALSCCKDLATCSQARDFVLYATESLRVGNGAAVVERGGALAKVVNGGTGLAEIGNDARMASLFAGGDVLLHDGSTVEREVIAGGEIERRNGVTLGSFEEGRPVRFPGLDALRVQIPEAHAGNVALEPSRTRTLLPGSWGQVHVKSRATLTLKSGVYYMQSFTLETDAILRLQPTNGPVYLYVRDGFTFRGSVAAGGRHDRLFVGYVGTSAVFLETAFSGTFVAPGATLSLRGPNGTVHRGSFFARRIETEPNVRIERHPFAAPWNSDGTFVQTAGARFDAASEESVESSGCACRVSGQPRTPAAPLFAGLALVALAELRRRMRRRA